MFVEIILILVTALAALTLFIKKRYRFWAELGFPCIEPPSLWKFRPSGEARSAVVDLSRNLYDQYQDEKIMGFWLMLKPALLVRDPELVKNILVREFNQFHDRGIYSNTNADPISGHLVALSGAKWRNIRVKMTPAFSSGKLKNMFPLFKHCGQLLTKVMDEMIEEDSEIGIRPLFQRFAIDIISMTAFGFEADSLRNINSPFLQYSWKLFQPNAWDKVRGLITFSAPSISKILNLRVFRKEISDFFASSILQAVKQRENSNVKRPDLIDILIQLRNADKANPNRGEDDSFDDVDLASQAFTFFAAGFETSASTLSWTIYELAKHQDMQDRVRKEITDVLNANNGELTYDAISAMKYMSLVVDETLRVYPVARVLSRVCTEDYKVPDTDLIIPKGVRTIISVYGMHQDPKFYPEPEKFIPERFTEEEKSKRPPCVYLPFGEGPRICIGMRFGLLEVKLGLTCLLSQFKFDVCDRTSVPMVFNPKTTLLQPKDDLFLKVSRL